MKISLRHEVSVFIVLMVISPFVVMRVFNCDYVKSFLFCLIFTSSFVMFSVAIRNMEIYTLQRKNKYKKMSKNGRN
jgi:hypothetical protein